jgi:hypothetical protein
LAAVGSSGGNGGFRYDGIVGFAARNDVRQLQTLALLLPFGRSFFFVRQPRPSRAIDKKE